MTPVVKKWGGWFLKLLFSAGLVWLLLRKHDLTAAWEDVKDVRHDMLILGGLLCFGVIFCSAWRWWFLIKTVSPQAYPSFSDIFSINYVGQFSTLFLPMTVGSDAVKVICLNRIGSELTETISNVVIDRFLSYLTLVYAALIMFPWAWKVEILRPALIVFAIAGILGTVFLFAASFVRKFSHKKPGSALWKWILRFSKDLHHLFINPAHAVGMIGIGILSHLLFSLMYYVLGIGLGININIMDCLVFIPAVVLVVMLPVSISGWGVREQAMITAFGISGVPASQVLLLSIVSGGIITLMSLPGLISWITLKKKPKSE